MHNSCLFGIGHFPQHYLVCIFIRERGHNLQSEEFDDETPPYGENYMINKLLTVFK